MFGKLHIICMKTEGFHAKIRCNLNHISSVKSRKIIFNSYNYNFFRYFFLFISIYINYVFLKIMFLDNNVSCI